MGVLVNINISCISLHALGCLLRVVACKDITVIFYYYYYIIQCVVAINKV